MNSKRRGQELRTACVPRFCPHPVARRRAEARWRSRTTWPRALSAVLTDFRSGNIAATSDGDGQVPFSFQYAKQAVRFGALGVEGGGADWIGKYHPQPLAPRKGYLTPFSLTPFSLHRGTSDRGLTLIGSWRGEIRRKARIAVSVGSRGGGAAFLTDIF